MKMFSDLIYDLQQKNNDAEKIKFLHQYLESADKQDITFAIALLLAKKPKRIIDTSTLKALIGDAVQLPDWLIAESHSLVGDLAETISLLLPLNEEIIDISLSSWVIDCHHHTKKSASEKQEFIMNSWKKLSPNEIYVFNKLILGTFKSEIDEALVIQILADMYGKDFTEVSVLIKFDWTAFSHTLDEVMQSNTKATLSKPFHFTRSENMLKLNTAIKNYQEWWIEYKYEGIRCQIVKRQGQIFIWDKHYNLLNEKLKSLTASFINLQHDFVIDTVIMGFKTGIAINIQPFIYSQKGLDSVNDSFDVTIMAFDIMEWNDELLNQLTLAQRKKHLYDFVKKVTKEDDSIPISIPERIIAIDLNHLNTIKDNARIHNADGLLFKHDYHNRIDDNTFWYKWKLDPFTIQVVLLYAQKGEGKFTNIFSDYTFGIMDGSKLISIAKTNEGITEEEIMEIDTFVKSNTLEKFGPVRTVEPQLVFELAFDSLNISKRHKSNLQLVGAQIVRWRRDLLIEEASQLRYLKGLLK